ncbi:MAG: MltA domain-containing protein [Bacteriovoracaceae bacterium]|nr:MltA domain-containing protein [Bacteriovoracaceae bacterium]
MKKFIALFLASLSLAFAQTNITPTRALNQSVVFEDDLDFKNLELALNRQLEAFERSPQKGYVRFGTKTYPASRLKDSAQSFLLLVQTAIECMKTSDRAVCLKDFSSAVNSSFNMYEPVPARTEPGYGSAQTTLYTAYYSPDLSGSRVQTERFNNPIYGLPQRAEQKSLTREQIDFDHALAGQGLEIFWVEDSLYNIYLLHVEGGGRIKVHNEDGSVENVFISYASGNGQKFQFLYKYMVASGMLKPEAAGIEAQRRYIDNNPDKAREIFASCPSYIFFKETQSEPLGVQNIPVTEGRSIAIDTTIYKNIGVITFVQSKMPRPDENGNAVFTPFSRFFLTQDTGGAIKGNARCDLYMGFGHEAEFAANNTKVMGQQFFLIKK